MLDNETKRRIDTARDILVGKLPDPKSQVEQITIALIYKFMDDMDAQSVEYGGEPTFFVGEYERFGWRKIFSPSIGGFEMLNLYGEAITSLNQNPHLPQLFRDVFKNAFLPYRDPETLKLFLKTINEFKYDHSERLGDAFEYLLSVLGSQGDAGQFRTPRHIIDFIVEVLQPKKNETICDPACGTAGFLISSYKHILRNNARNAPGDLLTPDERKRLMANIVGYDISPDMVRLSLVNMYLHDFPDPHIFEYDTLTSEEHWNESFDIVMANPPFMSPKGGIKPHKRFSLPANRSEVLFVDYIAEHINPVSGRAGVIVPEGIIFQSANAYRALRKMLVEKAFLYAVVSLPAGVFNPYSGVKTSILLFDKTLASKSDRVLFVKINNDSFGLGAQRKELKTSDLPDALNVILNFQTAILSGDTSRFAEGELPLQAFAVEKGRIAENADFNLSGDKYMTKEHRHSKYELIELREICEVRNGFAFKSDEYVSEGLRVIRIANVQKGEIVDYDPKYISSDRSDEFYKYRILEGDILISLTGNVGRVGRMKKEMLPALLNQRVGLLTPNKNINPSFLFNVLNTDKFEQDAVAASSGIAQLNLSTKWIEAYKIPLPPLSVQEEVVERVEDYQRLIDGAKQVVQSFKPNIQINPDWQMVELGEFCDFKRGPFGGSLKKEIFVDDGYKVYEQKHAIRNDFEIGDYYIDEAKFKEMRGFEVFPNDLIISCSGTMGKIAIAPENVKRGIINQALLKLTPRPEKANPLFIKVWLESDQIQNRYFRDTSGAAIQNVASVKFLKEIPFPNLSLEEQRQIVAQIEREQSLVNGNHELIDIYERKIKDEINQLWES